MITEAHAEHPALSIRRLCQLTGTGRTWYYTGARSADRGARDAEVLEAILAVRDDDAGQHYGIRRLTAALQRQGWLINHKRVARILRQNALVFGATRRFVVTTDSGHGQPIYPNLLPPVCLERPNQVWVADLTYIQLPATYCYLACVLDAFSRVCVGWQLGRTLATSLPLGALDRAIAARNPPPGLIHHSDRGAQYASVRYTDRLQECGIRISMSRSGNPYDNATMESFYKTLKHEAVALPGYQSFAEADANLQHWIGTVYNTQRLHSRLGYRPPSEFEEVMHATPVAGG